MIDTSVLIAIERGGRSTPQELAEFLPRDAVLSAIVLGELRVGLSSAETDLQRSAATAYVGLVERSLPLVVFGSAEAAEWARLFVQLKRSGRLPGERDLQIAASAIAGGHSVLTGNPTDFDRVPDLLVTPWPARDRN